MKPEGILIYIKLRHTLKPQISDFNSYIYIINQTPIII